ncbi:hypothetical protein NM208_g6779 [Fusarium decemcellulare]|uniref:Uncharacterized protein n=1 Tax=Fusarium decemcellulare TaxID=57161 RepID=A0ACC1SC45_9HYPO|nr:hypothetical protein NM208_g6779 [Fusarium decemcellulare]
MDTPIVADQLCPPGETRTGKELIVKLVIAHVTAAAAFCNLLSLRNEPLASIEPVIFLLSPLIVILQTALGLAVMAIVFVRDAILSPRSLRQECHLFARRWRILFCKKPRPGVNSALSRTPTGKLEAGDKNPAVRPGLGEAWAWLGRTLAVFGTLYQCGATIFLYKRRIGLHGFESLTIVDHRSFELAVGGAAVSLLSLPLLLKFPGFAQPAPEIEYIAAMETEPMISFLRGDTRRCRAWYQIIYFSDLGSHSACAAYFFCFVTSTLKGTPVAATLLGAAYPGFYEKAVESWGGPDHSGWVFARNLAFTVVILGIVGTIAHQCSSERLGLWMLVPTVVLLVCTIGFFWIFMMYIFLPTMFIWFPGMMSGSGSVLFVKGKELRDLFRQPPFVVASEEYPACPALWKDPMAEDIWSLM